MADTDNTNPETNASTNPALFDAEHPDHAAAVQRNLDRFREPSDRVATPPPAAGGTRSGAARSAVWSAEGNTAIDKSGLPLDPKHPYWVADVPGHAQAVADTLERIRAATADDDAAAADDADAQQRQGKYVERSEFDMHVLRQRSGIPPITLPAAILEQVDHQANAQFMSWSVDNRLDPKIATAARDAFFEAALSGRDWSESEARFKAAFRTSMTPGQVNRLIRFARVVSGRDERTGERVDDRS
jgi:hypothetical protein